MTNDNSSETWEVALCWDEASRVVVARDVDQDTLWAVLSVVAEDHWETVHQEFSSADRRALARVVDILKAQPARVGRMGRLPGIMVTRSDQTPEALRSAWESEFYDITKSGAKRRRYKKPQIERDWEAWIKKNKAEQRLLKADAKTGTECRECGDRWSAGAAAYGLHHECGRGLVA